MPTDDTPLVCNFFKISSCRKSQLTKYLVTLHNTYRYYVCNKVTYVCTLVKY